MSSPGACPDANDLAAYLDGHTSVARDSEIEAHLAGCEQCRDILAAMGPTSTGQATLAAEAPLAHPRGGKVGRYLTLQELGRGGMGVVYRAYDPELDRRVALKLVRADRQQQTALRQRLVREAQAMARVSHRNVLTVYDAGTVDDEVYIAMALVEGGTLRQWLRAEPRPQRAILEKFIAAGRGLEAAHAAELVHRDFKPDNVLVDGAGQVYVTDFGLARASPSRDLLPPSPVAPIAGALPDATLTQTGALLGTPAFMAPEQMSGGRTDARGDQFSFCVALYQALAGQLPFTGRTVAERLASIARGPAPVRGLPAWLERALQRGLRLEPDARWPSMEALLARLEADPARRRRRRAAALLAAAAVAATALGAVGVQRRRALACRAAAREVDGAWNDGRRRAMQAAFAATGKPFAGPAFTQAAQLLDDYARGWQEAKQHACADTRVERAQPDDVLQLREGCLDERLAELRRMTGLFAAADATLVARAADAVHGLPGVAECADAKTLAREERLPSDGAARARVTATRVKLAEVRTLRRAGKYRDADREASALEAEVTALAHRPTEAEYWLLMTAIAGDRHDAARIRAYGKKAILAAESVPFPRVAFMAWHFLFHRAARDGYGPAADEAEAQMAAWADTGAFEDAHTYLIWDRGRRQEDTGSADEAVALFEQTLQLAERTHANRIAESVVNDLGNAYALAHRFDRAEEMFKRDIARVALQGAHHPAAAPALNNLGSLYLDEHKLPEAKALFEQSLAVYLDAYGPDDSRVGEEYNSLSATARMQHQPVEAERLARQATATFEKSLGRDHPMVAYGLVNLGAALVAEGRAAEALPPLERALGLRTRVTVLPLELAQSEMYLGFALGEVGRDRARAQQLLADARLKMTQARDDDDVAEIDRWLAKHPR